MNESAGAAGNGALSSAWFISPSPLYLMLSCEMFHHISREHSPINFLLPSLSRPPTKGPAVLRTSVTGRLSTL